MGLEAREARLCQGFIARLDRSMASRADNIASNLSLANFSKATEL